MGLPNLKQALRREVLAGMHRSLFDAAKQRHPALAGHETVLSVLAVLDGRSTKQSYAEKEALIRALLEEQQAQPHPFWATVLLVAFHPMLCRLRARLAGGGLTAQDLDQLVVTAFLEAVAVYPLGGEQEHTFLFLRRATQRLVFVWLDRERRELSLVQVVETRELLLIERGLLDHRRELGWPELLPQPSAPPDPEERGQLAAFLAGRLAGVLDAESLELAIATFVHGERLRTFAERACADLPIEQRGREYQRLKRRRLRTIATMRRELAVLRGRGEAAGFAVSQRQELALEGMCS